jgi:tetratricopeptide (TPR) repeat protein
MKRALPYLLTLPLLGCGSPKAPTTTTHEQPDQTAKTDHDHAGHGSAHAGHAAEPPASPNPRGAYLKTNCGAAAQREFDQGFFFLHNMDYTRARAAFERGATAEPGCAMVSWGLAMSYFHPLWAGTPTKDAMTKGAKAVEAARAAAKTDVERDYIAAVGAFYDKWETTEYAARIKSWAAGQQQLADKYRDDVEAQAFNSLARLAIADTKDKTYAVSIAVGEDIERLMQKRPEHPGLMHYLIHAYDNPALAARALEVSTKYMASSPDAAHALHMPSHIYTRVGEWQKSIDANIKSAAAGLGNAAKLTQGFMHASDYLAYGYLQIGDDDNAKATAAKFEPTATYEENNGPVAYSLASTPSRVVLERRDFKAAAALVPRQVPYNWDQYPWADAIAHAAHGLGAARTADVKTANKELAELQKIKKRVESPWWAERVQIEHDVVAAWVAWAKKDKKKALALVQDAAKRETAGGKDSIEPGHVIVAVEELGDMLLELKKPKDALEAYETSLKESPRRFNALYGAGRAAELAGLADKAKDYYAKLVEIAAANSPRPELARAKEYLAKSK